jgi:hypothetical protein
MGVRPGATGPSGPTCPRPSWSVRTYDGTYTVANGVIASAHITQTS